mmetsp:Transcript_12178/g.22817  ORF Transcript_12178/g.22817 Transcript_12178/m.22817 type:complete len:626 (+) Transcript_12178:112-1989(+)
MDSITDGWDDEEIDVDDGTSDNEMHARNNDNHFLLEARTNATGEDDALTQRTQEGWEWDDDIDVTGNNASNFLPDDKFPDTHSNIAKEKLISYIEDLHSPALVKSLNEILNEECNNTEFALKLCRYFHQREKLREYTLDVEVPRMDYQIILSDELILTEATEIRQHFAENPVDNLVDDMLLRSANQAILADIFPIITGPDKMIRIQFLANAIASKCRLVLDMRSARTLQVDCTMNVSIPSGMPSPPQSTKLDLAKFRLFIQFSPEPSAPFVNYHIDSIQPLVDVVVDERKIELASEAIDLNNLDILEREWVSSNSYELRDNFLESIMSTQTAAGLKSALREIDGVVNMSSKFNLIKQHLVLPSADEILNAEDDEDDLPQKPEENSVVLQHDEMKQSRNLPMNKPPATKRQVPPPPGHPPPSLHHGGNKPKPIIGGLLMSGISRLAMAASVQDEGEQPVLYKKDDQGRENSSFGSVEVLKVPPPTKEDRKSFVNNNILNNDNKDLDDPNDDGWSDDGLDEIDGSCSSDHEENVCASNAFNIQRKGVNEAPSNVNHMSETADRMYIGNLTPELRMERDYLLQKLAEISQVKNDYLNTYSNEVPHHTASGVIPTRKRFVSRAEILKLR